MGSYLRLIDFVYHSTLGLGVIEKNKRYLVNEALETLPLGFGLLVLHAPFEPRFVLHRLLSQKQRQLKPKPKPSTLNVNHKP